MGDVLKIIHCITVMGEKFGGTLCGGTQQLEEGGEGRKG